MILTVRHCLCAVSAALLLVTKLHAVELATWTAKVSVEREILLHDPTNTEDVFTGDNPVLWSPDRKRFLIITRKGSIAENANYYNLHVFSTEEISQAIRNTNGIETTTEFLLTRKGSVRADAINHAKWVDNTTVQFSGAESPWAGESIYRADIVTKQVARITDLPPAEGPLGYSTIDLFSFTETAGVRVYLARQRLFQEPQFVKYPFEHLRGMRLANYTGYTTFLTTDHLMIAKAGSPSVSIYSYPMMAFPPPIKPALSPDANWVLGIEGAFDQEKRIPDGWKQYEGLELPFDEMKPLDQFRIWRWKLVDVQSGCALTVLDAPLGPQTPRLPVKAIWSPDSKRVILMNTCLPLKDHGSIEPGKGYLVSYDLVSRLWSVIEPMVSGEDLVYNASWIDNGNAVLVQHKNAEGALGTELVFHWAQGKWSGRKVDPIKVMANPSATNNDISNIFDVTLIEDENTPTKLVAKKNGKEAILFDEASGLEGVARARNERVTWTERGGLVDSGMLLLPPGETEMLPLVVQIGYEPSRFLPEGPYRTALAAQPLATRGFAVLQIPDSVRDIHGESMKVAEAAGFRVDIELEFELMSERVEAAVTELIQKGKVDPNRIGLIGFSRNGQYVHYIISHPKKVRFGAAVVADSSTAGYYEYITHLALEPINSDFGGYGRFFDQINYWQHRESWAHHSPAFNADKINTPTMFMYSMFQPTPGREWLPGIDKFEPIAAFRQNRRPFELTLYPNGDHQFQSPLQQYAAMENHADWMSFWLLGVEDSQPSKEGAYRHWRKLRSEWIRQKAWEKSGHPVGSTPGSKAD